MHEYSKKIHNQAAEIGRELLEKLLANKDVFVPEITEEPAAKQVLMEKTGDFGNEVMQYLATKDIPARYATMGIEKLIEGLTGLKAYIDGTLTSYEDEYLSRSFGIKNADGKFRREDITVSQLVLKLEDVRQSTGNERNDFFNEVAPKMPVMGDIEEAASEEIPSSYTAPESESPAAE